MKLATITEILRDLYETREERSKSKFSGVHFVNGVYRVHIDTFIPRAFCDDAHLWDNVATVVAIAFPLAMLWDAQTLWLTMKDPE